MEPPGCIPTTRSGGTWGSVTMSTIGDGTTNTAPGEAVAMGSMLGTSRWSTCSWEQSTTSIPTHSPGASGESWSRPSYGERNGSRRTVVPPPRAAKLAWPNQESAASPSLSPMFVRRSIEVSLMAPGILSRGGRDDRIARPAVEDVDALGARCPGGAGRRGTA